MIDPKLLEVGRDVGPKLPPTEVTLLGRLLLEKDAWRATDGPGEPFLARGEAAAASAANVARGHAQPTKGNSSEAVVPSREFKKDGARVASQITCASNGGFQNTAVLIWRGGVNLTGAVGRGNGDNGLCTSFGGVSCAGFSLEKPGCEGRIIDNSFESPSSGGSLETARPPISPGTASKSVPMETRSSPLLLTARGARHAGAAGTSTLLGFAAKEGVDSKRFTRAPGADWRGWLVVRGRPGERSRVGGAANAEATAEAPRGDKPRPSTRPSVDCLRGDNHDTARGARTGEWAWEFRACKKLVLDGPPAASDAAAAGTATSAPVDAVERSEKGECGGEGALLSPKEGVGATARCSGLLRSPPPKEGAGLKVRSCLTSPKDGAEDMDRVRSCTTKDGTGLTARSRPDCPLCG